MACQEAWETLVDRRLLEWRVEWGGWGGMGSPPSGMPGMSGGSPPMVGPGGEQAGGQQAPMKIQNLSIWDVLERILEGKPMDDKENPPEQQSQMQQPPQQNQMQQPPQQNQMPGGQPQMPGMSPGGPSPGQMGQSPGNLMGTPGM